MLLPQKHRLARRKTIKWSDLASEKFLLLHEIHSLSIQVRQLLAANKLKPEVVLQELNSLPSREWSRLDWE